MNIILKVITLLCAAFAPALSLADCDVAAGKKQYNKCSACHSIEPGVQLMGPSLHGLIGRQVGSLDDFVYSQALEEAGFEWTEQSLSEFLENPMQYVPGTVMPFGGMRKAEQRDALVCYIGQLN